jgi:hypothetical protein
MGERKRYPQRAVAIHSGVSVWGIGRRLPVFPHACPRSHRSITTNRLRSFSVILKCLLIHSGLLEEGCLRKNQVTFPMCSQGDIISVRGHRSVRGVSERPGLSISGDAIRWIPMRVLNNLAHGLRFFIGPYCVGLSVLDSTFHFVRISRIMLSSGQASAPTRDREAPRFPGLGNARSTCRASCGSCQTDAQVAQSPLSKHSIIRNRSSAAQVTFQGMAGCRPPSLLMNCETYGLGIFCCPCDRYIPGDGRQDACATMSGFSRSVV